MREGYQHAGESQPSPAQPCPLLSRAAAGFVLKLAWFLFPRCYVAGVSGCARSWWLWLAHPRPRGVAAGPCLSRACRGQCEAAAAIFLCFGGQRGSSAACPSVTAGVTCGVRWRFPAPRSALGSWSFSMGFCNFVPAFPGAFSCSELQQGGFGSRQRGDLICYPMFPGESSSEQRPCHQTARVACPGAAWSRPRRDCQG